MQNKNSNYCSCISLSHISDRELITTADEEIAYLINLWYSGLRWVVVKIMFRGTKLQTIHKFVLKSHFFGFSKHVEFLTYLFILKNDFLESETIIPANIVKMRNLIKVGKFP